MPGKGLKNLCIVQDPFNTLPGDLIPAPAWGFEQSFFRQFPDIIRYRLGCYAKTRRYLCCRIAG
jgi:hypothetical protein